MSDFPALKQIVEGAILAADRPLSIDQMIQLFEGEQPSRAAVREVLAEIAAECEGKGYELKEVASGYRFQVRTEYSEWVGRLWEEKPPRYSRALLETLALIAYKQPITRGDIEEIRGVTVSTNIMRSLLEREWIRVVGHRDVPGRPAIYATTRTFLDYFNLSSLDELPTLSEIKDLDKMNPELDLEEEPMEARTIELEPAEEEQAESGADDVDLEEIGDQVDQIQENVRNLFAGDDAEEDDLDDLDEDSETPAGNDANPDAGPADDDTRPNDDASSHPGGAAGDYDPAPAPLSADSLLEDNDAESPLADIPEQNDDEEPPDVTGQSADAAIADADAVNQSVEAVIQGSSHDEDSQAPDTDTANGTDEPPIEDSASNGAEDAANDAEEAPDDATDTEDATNRTGDGQDDCQ